MHPFLFYREWQNAAVTTWVRQGFPEVAHTQKLGAQFMAILNLWLATERDWDSSNVSAASKTNCRLQAICLSLR